MVVFLSCAEENRVKTRNSGLISSEFKELFSFPFLHSSSCNIQRLRLCPIMWCKCGPTCPHVRTSQPPDLRIYIHNFFFNFPVKSSIYAVLWDYFTFQMFCVLLLIGCSQISLLFALFVVFPLIS